MKAEFSILAYLIAGVFGVPALIAVMFGNNGVGILLATVAVVLLLGIARVATHRIEKAKTIWTRLIDDFAVRPNSDVLASANQGVVSIGGLYLIEVTRHFDERTSGEINGWLGHTFSPSGWAVGAQGSRFGLTVGTARMTGSSAVRLTTESRTRAELASDGFVALFEWRRDDGTKDVYRAVAPSAAMCREFAREAIEQVVERLPDVGSIDKQSRPVARGLLTDQTVRIMNLLSFESSYIADRFVAMMALPPADRPEVTVVGPPIESHTLLAASVSVGGDSRWYEVLPLDLTPRLQRLADDMSAVLA